MKPDLPSLHMTQPTQDKKKVFIHELQLSYLFMDCRQILLVACFLCSPRLVCMDMAAGWLDE